MRYGEERGRKIKDEGKKTTRMRTREGEEGEGRTTEITGRKERRKSRKSTREAEKWKGRTRKITCKRKEKTRKR
jgi:hypothetical protein